LKAEEPETKMLTEKEAYSFAIQQVDLAIADMASQEAINLLFRAGASQAVIKGMIKLRDLVGLDNSMYAPAPKTED
jgi:hypothetical protein